MIEVRELTKRFGPRTAVDRLTFDVAAGETVGFLGPNGAGKSTTMRLLTGFLGATSGRALVNGFDVAADPLAVRRSIGYLPESNPLYRDMRVREFLRYRARLKGVERRRRRAEVEQALECCRVADVADRIIGQLSKGYRQRVGLADGILGRPPLLILDEPTVGLDPNQVVETRALIRELGAERTVFLSTHILHEVELLCRRVLIIDRGRLVADGTPADLRRRYAPARRLAVQVVAGDGSAAPETEAVRQTLRGVAGIRRADPDDATDSDGVTTWRVETDPTVDVRRDLARAVLARDWLVREIREEPVRLEDIFARLTQNRPGS